jgi:kynureninase
MALAPVKASMQIFDRVGMPALREKSLKLTAYLEWLITQELARKIDILTPREPDQRGAQLSLVVKGATRDIEQRLHNEGVVVDFREPNVIRVAPTPLYNSFHDVWQLVQTLKTVLA